MIYVVDMMIVALCIHMYVRNKHGYYICSLGSVTVLEEVAIYVASEHGYYIFVE